MTHVRQCAVQCDADGCGWFSSTAGGHPTRGEERRRPWWFQEWRGCEEGGAEPRVGDGGRGCVASPHGCVDPTSTHGMVV